jgi:hypothetical protein
MLDAGGFQPLGLVLLEVQGNLGAAAGLLGGLHGELAGAVGDPAPGLAFAGLPRHDLDLVRHHEGGIEADAELADEAHLLFLGLGLCQFLGELGRARTGRWCRDG